MLRIRIESEVEVSFGQGQALLISGDLRKNLIHSFDELSVELSLV